MRLKSKGILSSLELTGRRPKAGRVSFIDRMLHPPKPKLNEIVKKKLPPTALLEFQRPEDRDNLPEIPHIPENLNMADKLDGWSFAVPDNV